MCLSRLGQILYGIAMFVALALTLSAALTPGWRQIEVYANNTTRNASVTNPGKTTDKVNAGLFSFLCVVPGEDTKSTAQSAKEAEDYCKDWWKNQPTWEKAVVVLVCVAVVVETIALIYNFITFCCCCCRGHALKPLAPLALICFILLGIAVAIFAIKNKEALDGKTFDELKDDKNAIGYSFFLACGALALLLVNVVIGSLSACLGDKCF